MKNTRVILGPQLSYSRLTRVSMMDSNMGPRVKPEGDKTRARGRQN
jgi:hypothetical protein